MKVRFTTIVVLVAVTFANSQPVPQDGTTIAVYGLGIIELPANRANIGFSVKGFGPTMAEAVAVTQTKLAEITTKLFAVGLTPKNLTTSSLTSGDNFEGKAFLSSSRDFRTQVSVQVTIDSLELVDKIITTLAGSQLEQLSNVSFSLKNDSTLKLESRRLAVANAQDKAALMAKQLGVSLGKPIQVEELLSYSDGDFYLPPKSDPPAAYMATRGVSVGGGSMIYYGAQRFSVRAGVRVVFQIVR